MSLQARLQKIEDQKKEYNRKYEEEKQQALQGYIKTCESIITRFINKKKVYDLTTNEIAGALTHLYNLKKEAANGDENAKDSLNHIVGLGTNFRAVGRPKKNNEASQEAA